MVPDFFIPGLFMHIVVEGGFSGFSVLKRALMDPKMVRE